MQAENDAIKANPLPPFVAHCMSRYLIPLPPFVAHCMPRYLIPLPQSHLPVMLRAGPLHASRERRNPGSAAGARQQMGHHFQAAARPHRQCGQEPLEQLSEAAAAGNLGVAGRHAGARSCTHGCAA
eukprot:295699-Chlamydomonas_euryale.AAC.1